MKPALRRLWLKLHRWTALSLGMVLAGAALLGALLTVAKPLDRWAHPELFLQQRAPGAAGASLESIRQRLAAEFGPGASFTFRPPRQAGDTHWVSVRGPWDGRVFFDAETGAERGRRDEHEGFYNLLFELHSSLLLGETGKAVLTSAALAYLFLLATGLVLWWPARWPPRLSIRWRAGSGKWLYDLHNVGGVLLGAVILVSVLSGAYMAWPPLRTLVSSAAGQAPVKPPTLPAPGAAAALPLDELVARARQQFSDGMVGYVQWSPAQPVRVRFKLPQDPHPNGITSVWLDPATGGIIGSRRFDALDVGSRWVSVVYPLHTGELGGTALIAVVGLTGAALATLGATGLVLWWTRRRARRAAARPAAASSAADAGYHRHPC